MKPATAAEVAKARDRLATWEAEEPPPNITKGVRLINQPRIAKPAAPKRKAPPRPPAPRNRTKGAERESHGERTAEIRAAVFARAGETPEHRGSYAPALCELCPPDRLRGIAHELAHLEGGVGRRRQRQSVENTAASCRDCNKRWDTHPAERLMVAARWSERTGLPIPRGVIAAAALKGWAVRETQRSER